MIEVSTVAVNTVAALQQAWQAPGAGRSTFSRPGVRRTYLPIAGSAQDQLTPAGTANPYWDIVRWMPAQPRHWQDGAPLDPSFVFGAFPREIAFDLHRAGASRSELTGRFAWSIVSPGDVAWMTGVLDGRAVVEIGAGTGYWAWQLEQADVDVAAYDPYAPAADNQFCKTGPYTTVLTDDASAVRHHLDRALLMVWPPFGGSHARQALAQYKGDLVIYAGEDTGGCTADDDFYDLLQQEWQETSVAPQHVTWWGIHCKLAAYHRKGGDGR